MMAIEPIAEKIIEITHPDSALILIGKNDALPLSPEGDPLLSEDTPLSPTGDTPSLTGYTPSPTGDTLFPTGNYSKTTTKTTTKITTTTGNTDKIDDKKENIENSSKSGGGSGGNRLIFDFALADWTISRQQRAEKTLEGLEQETAQAVLDELNESVAAGKVKQPLPWLRKVAERARLGEFEPTNEITDRRETEKRRQNNAVSESEAKPSQLWKDHKNDLKTKFDDNEFKKNIVPLRGIEHGKVLLLESTKSVCSNLGEEKHRSNPGCNGCA